VKKMPLFKKVIALLVTGLWLCSYGVGIFAHAIEPPPPLKALVAKTKSQVTTSDMDSFKTLYDKKDYDWIIDVREPEEYNSGHIPQAINIPRGVIEIRIWALAGYPEKMDTGIRLFLYCGTGTRCTLAAKSLQDLGFTRVIAVDMQLADWVAAGYPMTEAEPAF
jgi:rhodanese-related sulfurtransferase